MPNHTRPILALPSRAPPVHEKIWAFYPHAHEYLHRPTPAHHAKAPPSRTFAGHEKVYGNSRAVFLEKKDSFAMASVFSLRSESFNSSELI